MKKVQLTHRLPALAAALLILLGSAMPLKASEPAADASAPLPAIISFDALADDTAAVIYDVKPSLAEVLAALPAALSVTLEGAPASTALPVTWQCAEDYDNTTLSYYMFTPSWDTASFPLSASYDAAQLPHITVLVNAVRSTVYLVAPDQAKSTLDTLAKEKNILALIYLSDSYDIKKAPGVNQETLVQASSGQSVRITGVSEDLLRNIWFQVSFNISGTDYSGYVERDHLAYSDEDLLNWEYQNISSYFFRSGDGRSADPYADVTQFPESYQTALKALKDAHPGWTFVKMDTGLDWTTAVREENSKDRSLITARANAAWKTGPYDSSWAYPTDGILAYYMDPRNFLTEAALFQFELLSYNENYHTQAIVQSMLDSTFMNGLIPGDSRTYAEAFFGIGRAMNVSPFHLAARVRVEQGAGTSPLISGTYPGYEGCYNYFNIGASGQGTQVIINGLTYARGQGWNTRYLSLEGGARILSKNYISRGQDSLYLQKFNVNVRSASGAYNHQYMQNIAAPSSEASIVYRAYTNAGVAGKPFVFKIPVYNDMPSSACTKPAELNEITLDKTAVTLKAGASATLKAFLNGTGAAAGSVTFISSNAAVAAVDANGTVTAVSPGSADISCTQSGGTTAVCKVTVQKAEPSYTVPTLDGITYDSGKTLADVVLPSGWTWDSPATVPTVAVSSYPATFTPSDTVNYNTVKKLLTLNVAKGTPSPSSYTVPTGLQTVSGNTLASLKLPAGFTWETPGTVLDTKGTVTCKASYNPDPANCNTVTGIDIAVTVNEKAAEECTTHTFGEWETAAGAGCTTPGSDTRSCHVCGYKETRTFPALGHSYTAAVTKEPTEAETGIRTCTCTRCGDSYTETIAALPPSHKHSYTAAVTKEATCTEKGVKTFTCSCGDSYTEDMAPIGHNYSAAVTKQPTEAETGVRTYTCTGCGDSYTETIAKLPPSHKHSYTSAVTKEASCTEKGVKTFTCSCGDSYTEDIAAPGHNMANGKCTRCGYTQTGSSGSTSGSSSGTAGTGSASNPTGNAGTGSSGSGTSSQQSNPEKSPQGNPEGNSPGSLTNSPGSNAANAGGKTQGSGTSGQSGHSAASGKNSQKDSGQKNVSVDMKSNTVLYEETIASIRGKDVEVVLDMGGNVSWTVNGSNIVYDEANGIDMGVTLDGGTVPSSLLEQFRADGGYTVIELTLAHSGPLDFQPVLTVNTAKENAGRIASLFYFDPEAAELQFVASTEVTEDGDISFTFTHASDYVIIVGDEMIGDSVIINETVPGGSDPASNAVAEDGETAGKDAAADGKGRISPAVVVILVLILLIGLAIGVTVYLMIGRREQEDLPESLEKEEGQTKEYLLQPQAPEDKSSKDSREKYPEKKKPEKREKYLDDDESSPSDDYHEPAVEKKAGKVVSAKKAKAGEFFDEDEFDGFE